MRKDLLWWLSFALVGAGLILWGINWWANRPLFLDEANIARNLYDRSFTTLFSPLDHKQYAPPLYLVIAKACGALFGYTERSLRLPALLGGIMAIYGLIVGSKALKLRWWALLPLALLFVNPTVLRFVGELKPYGLDLGVAALFVGYGLKGFRPNWKWAVAGLFAIWLSLPSVFILAALGSHYFYRALRSSSKTNPVRLADWFLAGGAWIVSFVGLYLLIIRPSVGSQHLEVYHRAYFFPIPGQGGFWSAAGDLSLTFPKLAFGYTALAITVGVFVVVTAFAFRKARLAFWLLLPVVFAIFASTIGHYSLIPRLLLFTLPGWWLLAAQVSEQLTKRLPPYGRVLLVGLWLLVLAGTNVIRHYRTPEVFSDVRDLTWELQEGYTPILHHGAVPGYDFYQRIHPKGPQSTEIVQERNIKHATFPGKYVLLYDVLTQGNIRTSAEQDSIWAAGRGCHVRTEPYFRAKAVYLDCP
ncbi:MAG: hypothetical protein AAF597_01855 [Bacteroidota bacterium]